MADLIDRQAAIDAVMRLQPYSNKRELINRIESSIADAEGYLGGIAMSLDELEDLDSIDAEPVRHERWIYICNSSVNGLKVCECTGCHRRTYGSLDFCGNCGAKMDGERRTDERPN